MDAFTGKEVWNLTAWAASGLGEGMANAYIADGYLTYINSYDNQLYCIGKGPSLLTVDAPFTAITQGQSVIIRGSVTDQSSGAKQLMQKSEFNTVPVISDAYMTPWMEYLYMQKPLPADATGVQVILTATDQNGNNVNIGTAITDTSGFYSFMWQPAGTGKYTILAAFEGSNSYWPSYAETAIGVTAAPAVITPTPTQTPISTITPVPTATITSSPTVAPEPSGGLPTETLIIAGVAVIIIVAVAVVALMLRKRK